MSSLLEVEGLRVRLRGERGLVTVVDRIDFRVEQGGVLGIAGESGSGKTMSVLALMGLLPAGGRVEGTARFGAVDLLSLPQKSLRRLCGREIAMVFQDPMTALHPMLSVEHQLTEHMRRHLSVTGKEARARAVALLEQVRIPDPAGALGAFPHQFSGGMRQRIALASALACDPKLLIADEPTTALDVTVQAGILQLLDRLRRERGLAIILITHDLSVMAAVADQVAVMYAGRVVEAGETRDVLQRPRHPYTDGLLKALPHAVTAGAAPLVAIPGTPPSPQQLPSGCSFHPRCPYATPQCESRTPELAAIGARRVACPVDPLRPAA